MVDADTVAVYEGRDDLAEDVDDVNLDETTLLVNVAEKFAAFNVFHNEIAATGQTRLLVIDEGTHSSSLFSQMS